MVFKRNSRESEFRKAKVHRAPLRKLAPHRKLVRVRAIDLSTAAEILFRGEIIIVLARACGPYFPSPFFFPTSGPSVYSISRGRSAIRRLLIYRNLPYAPPPPPPRTCRLSRSLFPCISSTPFFFFFPSFASFFISSLRYLLREM